MEEGHGPEATTSVDMTALLADSGCGAAVLGGRYRLGDVLGEGGMAVVHRATDLLLQRSVAVKVLRENVARTEQRARFADEVRTLAALSHSGLVTVLDAGVTAERPYLVMELVDGGTLAEVPTPLPMHQVADIGAQLASALAYAHGRGVIHRDVKPGNVLLGASGRVKLADFGIARLVGDCVHHTSPGSLIGTVTYLSPEQVEGAELTTAVDVYSLGLLLLELITGRRPFPGPSVESALNRLTRPPEMPLDLPAAWWGLLSAMTSRNPADRPTALDVSERLRALRVGPVALALPVPVEQMPVEATPNGSAPMAGHVRGALVAVAAVVLLIVAAGAAGGKGVRNAPPEAAGAAASGAAQSTDESLAGANPAGGATALAAAADTSGGRDRSHGSEAHRGEAAPGGSNADRPKAGKKAGRGHSPDDKPKDKDRDKDRDKDKGKDKHKGKDKGKHGHKRA